MQLCQTLTSANDAVQSYLENEFPGKVVIRDESTGWSDKHYLVFHDDVIHTVSLSPAFLEAHQDIINELQRRSLVEEMRNAASHSAKFKITSSGIRVEVKR